MGASAGVGMMATRAVLQHHSRAAKLGLVAALIGALIVATAPPEQREARAKAVAKWMAVAAVGVVLLMAGLLFFVLMVGVTMPAPGR